MPNERQTSMGMMCMCNCAPLRARFAHMEVNFDVLENKMLTIQQK